MTVPSFGKTVRIL